MESSHPIRRRRQHAPKLTSAGQSLRLTLLDNAWLCGSNDLAGTGISVHGAGGHALGHGSLVVADSAEDGRSPCDGTAHGFTNRNNSRLKLLIWDGTGLWLCHRRLHKVRFRWPIPGETLFRMSAEQWRWLIAGVDWQRLCATPICAVCATESRAKR
ncbi:MAG: IS66 family insertion sequence element accessory protein TnpB [Gallionella sp.]|nr:IS66 family insertion sequence element accessory protein TnpB [Gallionella sp.]